MKLLSFDIEISDVFELGKHEDMEKYAPFHISVAATAIHNVILIARTQGRRSRHAWVALAESFGVPARSRMQQETGTSADAGTHQGSLRT